MEIYLSGLDKIKQNFNLFTKATYFNHLLKVDGRFLYTKTLVALRSRDPSIQRSCMPGFCIQKR